MSTEMKNIAKVVYRNTMDGQIEVLRFENVMKQSEAEEKYGREVKRIYIGKPPHFYKNAIDVNSVYVIGDISKKYFSVGIYKKYEFEEMIKLMKLCGERLSNIKRVGKLEEYTKERFIHI